MTREVLVGVWYKKDAKVNKNAKESEVRGFLSKHGMVIESCEQIDLRMGKRLDYMIFPSNSKLPGIISVSESPNEDSKYFKAFMEASKSEKPCCAFRIVMDAAKSKLKILK